MSGASVPAINALPPGVLELVFRHFPRRPLLRIVSLVCRRWRGTALRCVTELTLTEAHITNPIAQRTLDHLSGLLTIFYCARDIPSHTGRLVPPPSLTGLNFLSFDHAPPLDWLPLRRITAQRVVAVDAFFVLLQRSQSTLESLDFFTSSVQPESKSAQMQFETLASFDLPALKELTLRRGWASLALLPLLARHSTQLVTLTLQDKALVSRDREAIDRFISLPFPRLRCLNLYFFEGLRVAQLARLLSAAPQLRELSAVGSLHSPIFPAHSSPVSSPVTCASHSRSRKWVF